MIFTIKNGYYSDNVTISLRFTQKHLANNKTAVRYYP